MKKTRLKYGRIGRGGEVMLQRGLAILLSVCMLAGGISDTAYAMSPQSDVRIASSVQSVSDTGEISELSTEDTTGGPAAEDGEKTEEDQAGSGDNSGNGGDGTENGSEAGATEGGAAGSETPNNGDGATGDGADHEGGTASDAADHEDGTAEDGTDSEGDTTKDGADNEGDTAGDDTGSESDAGQEDDNTTEIEDSGDTDAAVGEGDDETDAEDKSENEIDGAEEETKDSMSVLSVKEEELLLAVDGPQTVALAAEEQQWLSFTAPEDGLYRFYSTVEDSSYESKCVYLFHEKSDNKNNYFYSDYASGQNGNFSASYRMQAEETVYLLVEFGSSSTSGTFAVNAEKVQVPELTVTKNAEGDYTLHSDLYRLDLDLKPSYSKVKIGMKLSPTEGNELSGYSYRVAYKVNYDYAWGGTSDSSGTAYLSSGSGFETEIQGATYVAPGGEVRVTELQIRDSSNNILAVLGTDGQTITVNTTATEKQGVLTQVTADDASISVATEMMPGNSNNGRLRYRKKEETEWSYYKNAIDYYTNPITLPAEPDTDYVIELTATDMETVYDTAEIRTEAFAAADINTEVTNITSSGATIKVTVGAYTGSKTRICGRVSYVDSMGEPRTSTGYVNVSYIASGSINLSLSNLAAGTEYKELEVELDDTDSYSMEYAAYKTKVSFTTAASVLTAEQVSVTVTPDAQDGTKAVLNVALQGITEGSYSYTAIYRVAGSKDWKQSSSTSGTLASYNNYAAEQNLPSLLGNTEYEIQVMVDGISKAASFTTTSSAVGAKVEVKPLMQGVQVSAVLTGTETLSGTYEISVQYYDQDARGWRDASYFNYGDTRLTADNNWESTAVFYSGSIRPNAENDWKISISGIYEKYFSLTAVRQEISLTTENVMCTTAQIRATLAARDESIRYTNADLYYRAKDTTQWISGSSLTYSYEDGGTVYLSGLKEDTEYEVKLVPDSYPEDILAQTTFRTLKDTRSVSVSVDNCRYTSAQVNWTFDSGANVLDSSSYICIYYRKKDASTWNLINSTWRTTSYTGKELLKNLEAGTSYEVLVELKDSSSSGNIAGQNVVRDAKTEFATVAVDHELKAEPVDQETTATSVTFDMQLTKKTGTLENRAKAVVTLTSTDGSSVQNKTVYLNKDNQYKVQLKVNGLLPTTEYAVNAELYESENNAWSYLRDFDLGEVTTAEAKAPTALTISEKELLLNKGTSKKLTVTAQPQEAAAGLTWASSDETVVTVDRNGTVTARKAGEADITVSAAGTADGGNEKASAVSHVTVRDYEIRVKNTDGSYDSISGLLTKTQKRTLVVYDNTAGQDLAGVTWSSSNPNTAKISDDGLLEPQNYGLAYITANTEEGIIIKKGPIKVVNEIQGFSITRPENVDDSYRAIRTAEAVYQVAAGETYRVGCVLSPAYTDQYDSSVSMAADRFDWSADNSAVTVKVSEYDSDLTEITIPANVSGTVKVSAVMKDEEYKDKSFTITLDVLKKPEVEVLPDTYTWLDYSSKLQDVGLPENWQWKEQGTLIYEAGTKTFTARYTQSGYYPYEAGVTVHAEKIGSNLSVIGNYSTGKKAYIVKKETPLKVSINALGGSIPALLYEQSALAPAAKDAAKVNVSAPDETGYYSVTASAKGTYTVSAAVSLKKAAFEKKNGAYVLTAGASVKSTTASVKFMVVDSAPIKMITFAVAEDSPEKVTLTGDGTIEYEITAANADTKANERVIYLDVAATDTDGNEVVNPNINYTVSDAAVVKTKKDGTSRLVLTIPKGADGLAKIVATAKDELGYSTQFAVRVKDYTPRVTTYKTTINENYTYDKQIAQLVLPYQEADNDQIVELLLVETNNQGGKDKVAGLDVTAYRMSDDHKRELSLRIKDKAQIKKKGNLNYYLAITTKAYGGMIFVPVQIKIEEGMPAVSLRQTGKVNVFYTDTTHVTSYDAVSMGLVEVSSAASIESVRWVAGQDTESGANTEFVIDRYSTYVVKNGKYTKKYMIQQHKPILNSNKKPSDAAVKGNVYIRLSGYNEEVKLPLTIQTVYKKPKLKVADYKVCPALGEVTDDQYIYKCCEKQ